MSLQVWLPFNRDINSYGLCDISTLSVNSASLTTNGGGKLGNCLSLSSDGQAVSLNSYMDVCSTYTRYSMSAWIYMSSTATNHSSSILSSGDWNSGSGQLCFGFYSYSSDGYYKILVPNKSSWSNGISLSSPIKLNTWYNICITYDGNNTRGYVNGEYVGSYAGGGITASSGNKNLYVGSATYYSGFTLKGSINDVRIYDHCLSAKEVKEISKGLLCHYKLDNKGFGNPNLITTMSTGSGTTLNGKYGLNADFSRNADTYGYFNVSPALELDSTYTLSFDVSNFPAGSIWNFSLWNNSNYYIEDITKDGHYTYTFVPSESKLPSGYSLTKFLFDDGSRTNPSGMVYFTNFKIEKGNKPTSWCPHISDSLYTSLGLNLTIEEDCSGLGNNGTKVGSGSCENNSPRYSCSFTTNSTGKISSSKGFPIGVNPVFTVNFWLKSNEGTFAQWNDVFNIQGSHQIRLETINTSGSYFGWYNYPLGTASGFGEFTVSKNVWYMITLVSDGSKFYCYKDASLYNTTAFTGTGWTTNGAFTIGDSSGMYVSVSDVRIYSTALSAEDIKVLYTTSASVDKNGNMYAYEFKEE